MDFLIVLVAAATNIDFTVIIKVIKLSSKKYHKSPHTCTMYYAAQGSILNKEKKQ